MVENTDFKKIVDFKNWMPWCCPKKIVFYTDLYRSVVDCKLFLHGYILYNVYMYKYVLHVLLFCKNASCLKNKQATRELRLEVLSKGLGNEEF